MTIAVPPPRKRSRKERRAAEDRDDPLFGSLRAARRKLAAAAGLPPYVVFHDSTLREIAAARPRSLAELARIQGVGATKLERYGEAMLAAVAAHTEQDGHSG